MSHNDLYVALREVDRQTDPRGSFKKTNPCNSIPCTERVNCLFPLENYGPSKLQPCPKSSGLGTVLSYHHIKMHMKSGLRRAWRKGCRGLVPALQVASWSNKASKQNCCSVTPWAN